jgi:Tfp pilus assembly protein PilO
MISEMGDESGIRVTSALVRSDTMTKAPFARIAVRISATGDVEGLADYLRSIESAEQLLAVRELSVAQSEPGAPDSRAESLHFEMLVEGLVRLDPPRTSAIAMLVKK